jgi:uncharacterized protein (DUF885 family)
MAFGGDPGATRREVLAGLGALAFAPAARSRTGLPIRLVLEQAAAAGEPERVLAALRRVSAAGLDPADGVLLRMVTRGLEREVELRHRFAFATAAGGSPYVLSQRHGAWLRLEEPGLPPAAKARRLDEESDRLSSQAALGVSPPRFILDAVLSAQAQLRAKADSEVGPALARQSAALERLRASAAVEPGIWRLPGGEEYYRLRLRSTSGSDDSPAAVEALVAARTAALLRRADRLLKGLGLSSGSVGERLRALKRRPAYRHSADETGRTAAVAGMNAALARLGPNLRAWFNPPFETGGSVRRMTAAEERAGKRGYRDAVAGAYFPDLGAVQERPGWTLTTVAFHETLPGHLLQLGRQALADSHPLQVRHAPGYAEGWAIYAEALADRKGLLSPVEQLGFIQSLLFRLARVTADFGLHMRRWDRARAIRYLEDTVGFELFFPFAVEVDRYAAEPAAFAADALVALTLIRLGARAGGGQALRGFHDAVLNHGPLSAEAIERIA